MTLVHLPSGITYQEVGDSRIYIGIVESNGLATIVAIMAPSLAEAEKLAFMEGARIKLEPLMPFLQEIEFRLLSYGITGVLNVDRAIRPS